MNPVFLATVDTSLLKLFSQKEKKDEMAAAPQDEISGTYTLSLKCSLISLKIPYIISSN